MSKRESTPIVGTLQESSDGTTTLRIRPSTKAVKHHDGFTVVYDQFFTELTAIADNPSAVRLLAHLMLLRKHNTASLRMKQKQLAELIGVEQSTVSRALDALLKRQIVRRNSVDKSQLDFDVFMSWRGERDAHIDYITSHADCVDVSHLYEDADDAKAT